MATFLAQVTASVAATAAAERFSESKPFSVSAAV